MAIESLRVGAQGGYEESAGTGWWRLRPQRHGPDAHSSWLCSRDGNLWFGCTRSVLGPTRTDRSDHHRSADARDRRLWNRRKD